MTEYVLPVLLAIALWWSSTGVILYADGLPRPSFPRTMRLASLLLLAGVIGLLATRSDATVLGAYMAFVSGLVFWGWQQIAFYTGYLAGPRRHGCPESCSGWSHVRHAVGATLYHELSIAASALLIAALVWESPNRLALWTFLIFWAMHVSAKLNLFLGVRNLNEEFFPDHLRYLETLLRRRRMNPFLPLSVAAQVVLAVILFRQALAPGASGFDSVGFTLLGTTTILSILEHLLLVLPLPAARLWDWGLRSRRARSIDSTAASPAMPPHSLSRPGSASP